VARPSVEFHPEAIAEARAAYEWYADRDLSVANAFIAELDRAITEAQTAPERWPRHLHRTRKYLFRRFPYGVVYRITETSIQVLAVAHGRRRPGYWRTRQF
jgi:plasmid stabilization system protein ParE